MRRVEEPKVPLWLHLIRGLPGSGKTTYASTRLSRAARFSADDFFVNAQGVYVYDKRQIEDAHAHCRSNLRSALRAGKSCVIDNTFSRAREMRAYFDIGRICGARVKIVDLFDAGLSDAELAARNTHGVSQQAIAGMRERWEHGVGCAEILATVPRRPGGK